MSEALKTVLIVDDEKSVRQSLTDFFEDSQFKVLQANSGEKALEILRDESPEGALVDIRMGGMNGHSFVRKALIISPETAFILCTGSPDYKIPPDLKKSPLVSETLCRKPVINMNKLKKELLHLIDTIKKRKQ